MAESFHIVVVGGGPAGCVTALLLARRGYSVAIVDKAKSHSLQIGETLPPEATHLIDELKLSQAFAKQTPRPSPGVLSAWGSVDLHANELMFGVNGCGWHIDRAAFDRMLADAASQAGAVLFSPANVQNRMERDRTWFVDVDQRSRRVQLRATFIVDASGRCSRYPVGMPRRLVYDRLIAVAGLSDPSPNAARSDYTLVEASDEGWFYSALLPCGKYVVAFMTDADIFARRRHEPCYLHYQLKRAPHTASRVYTLPREHVIFSAVTSVRERVAGPNWLAVGDAARSFDPLSAQGLLSAMRSGIKAAAVVEGVLAGDSNFVKEYEENNRRIFARYLQLHHHYYQSESRWPDSTFWARRRRLMHPLRKLSGAPSIGLAAAG
jgi:flavin-dependent dehydrogenase